jgi:hypothetical protein
MHPKTLKLLLLLLTGFSTGSIAQSFTCQDFSITAVFPDSMNANMYQVSIQADGDPADLIGYPFIESVLDCNGDTVASGGLFWFGQLGQTTQDYPITLSGSLNCSPLTFVFHYLDAAGNTVYCPLVFGTTGLEANAEGHGKIVAFPNPSTGTVFIQSDKVNASATYSVYDCASRLISRGTLDRKSTGIDLNHIPAGVYIMHIDAAKRETIRLVID